MVDVSCGKLKQEGFDEVIYDKNINNESNAMCYCLKKYFSSIKSIQYSHVTLVLTLVFIVLSNNCCSARFYSTFDDDDRSTDSDSSRGWKVPDNEESEDSDNLADYQSCMNGQDFKGYTLNGGTSAGEYHNLGDVETFKDCMQLCCQESDCNIAIMLTYPKTGTSSCFQVDCHHDSAESRRLCKLKSARHSKYRPHLFKRGHNLHKQVATSEESTHSIINNEVKSVCHEYTGSVCAGNLDHSKLYYHTSSNDSSLDNRLAGPIKRISSRLSGTCRNLALQAICYRFYPQCADASHPKPIPVCQKECTKLLYGQCSEEFEDAKILQYLQRVIPSCSLPDDSSRNLRDVDENKNCIELNPDLNNESPTAPIGKNRQSEIVSTTSQKSSGSSLNNITSPSVNQNSDKRSFKAEFSNGTIQSSGVASEASQLNDTAILQTANQSQIVDDLEPTTSLPNEKENKNSEKLSIVDLKNGEDSKETNLEVLSSSITTTVTPLPIPTSKNADKVLTVSAGDNTEIILPVNYVSLYASTWPKEKHDGEYSYKWSQISAPKHSHGYIEGKTSKNVKLTKLNVPGVYKFQLDVTSLSGKHGVGYVNITVKEKSHINHPPRAEVYPKEQTITLPTDTVVLDGSKSSDDDKIVSYKWEELKGPIKHGSVFGSITTSKILQLKNLVAGVYHFRLTVTDSEGETDSTETTVTVKEEQDYPPKANAGSDVIIRLPNNSLTLNANESTDDKVHLTYAWSKAADSPTCDMQGTDKQQLRISSLTEGTYVFILKVTDSSGQESEARVKVVVLPELNTKPVAVAGDDKELKYPDTSTTLDGSKSTDNSKIIAYQWEKISGPDKIKMVGARQSKVHISDLMVGTYVIKLSVIDDKQLTGFDTVQIKVKRDHNEPPTAVISGGHQTIYLPTHSISLDGSKSYDDEIVTNFQWTRAGSSPAAGDVINGTDHTAVLELTNLVKGKYIFDLTVTDDKGLSGTASVIVAVKEDPNKMHLVEMFLDIDVERFTEESKKQFIRKVSVLLEVDKKFVKIEEVRKVHIKSGIMILFYIHDPNLDRKWDGKRVADLLKSKIGSGGKLFGYRMIRADPYVCRNNCSSHGYCDDATKECICDTFWMGNFIKAKLIEKESNCDWSILYLSVIVFAIFLVLIGVSWTICYLFARKKRNRRRARYRTLRSTDPDGAEDEILLIPKAMKDKFSGNSLTFTESDEDSDEENTVFDKNRIKNGHAQMNGSMNGKLKHRDRAL